MSLYRRGYWSLTKEQAEVVRALVVDRNVVDLGAGDLSFSEQMVKFGARSVRAIEPREPRWGHVLGPKIQLIQATMKETPPQKADVALVSWPSTYSPLTWEYTPHFDQADTVIYVGNNVDGTACGTATLFQYFLTRELIEHVPDRRNTLLVYAGKCPERQPVGEELAGMTHSHIMTYDELYGTTATKGSPGQPPHSKRRSAPAPKDLGQPRVEKWLEDFGE